MRTLTNTQLPFFAILFVYDLKCVSTWPTTHDHLDAIVGKKKIVPPPWDTNLRSVSRKIIRQRVEIPLCGACICKTPNTGYHLLSLSGSPRHSFCIPNPLRCFDDSYFVVRNSLQKRGGGLRAMRDCGLCLGAMSLCVRKIQRLDSRGGGWMFQDKKNNFKDFGRLNNTKNEGYIYSTKKIESNLEPSKLRKYPQWCLSGDDFSTLVRSVNNTECPKKIPVKNKDRGWRKNRKNLKNIQGKPNYHTVSKMHTEPKKNRDAEKHPLKSVDPWLTRL